MARRKQALRFYASGSLQITIFSLTMLMIVSVLHQWQNRGKLSKTVLSNTFTRVLQLHRGQLIQSDSLLICTYGRYAQNDLLLE